jgi:hypothetical protein
MKRNAKKHMGLGARTYGWLWLLFGFFLKSVLHVIIIVKECSPDLYQSAVIVGPKRPRWCDGCMCIKTCWILVPYVLYYKVWQRYTTL